MSLPGVTGNDLDEDGDALTVTVLTQPANGTLIFNADGTFDYTPNGVFAGVDTFTYQIDDGTDISGPVTVTITTLTSIAVDLNGPR